MPSALQQQHLRLSGRAERRNVIARFKRKVRAAVNFAERIGGLRTKFPRELLRQYAVFMAMKYAVRDVYMRFDNTFLTSPPPEIDAVWHEHMSRPLSYVTFCRLFLDKNDVFDHDPATADDPQKRCRITFTRGLFDDCRRAVDFLGDLRTTIYPVVGWAGHIFLKHMSGPTVSLSTSGMTKTEELKRQVSQKYGFPLDQLMFVFAGKSLEPGKTLESLGIGIGSTIFVMHTLRGC